MVKTHFYPSNFIQKLQEYTHKVFSPLWWCTAIQTGALFISCVSLGLVNDISNP